LIENIPSHVDDIEGTVKMINDFMKGVVKKDIGDRSKSEDDDENSNDEDKD